MVADFGLVDRGQDLVLEVLGPFTGLKVGAQLFILLD